MSGYQFAFNYLHAIEKKHQDYFKSSGLKIMDCVAIKGTKNISVYILNKNLPFEIRYDIEIMFWVE
ncbi:MAG: hypothetical protein ABI367_11225 [Mucilaginibacter sp.]